MKVAVIGASGCIGLRLVERLHLGDAIAVVPIVHTYRSLAVLARFDLPWRVADPADADQLAVALEGCTHVVHAALGDPVQIVRLAEALYPAAAKAGVRRIVALSSAAVHGLAPVAGTDETTRPLPRQASAYNQAKRDAERVLDRARRGGTVELVQLRPGLVHGPRSRFVAGLAHDLLAGTAWLTENGHGICNAVGIDNLVDAVRLALVRPEADRRVFLLNDRESVTWLDFYTELARVTGADVGAVHRLVAPAFAATASERLAAFAARPTLLAALPLLPARVKRLAKAAAAAWPERPVVSGWTLPSGPGPEPYAELCDLQRCHWRLPTRLAEQVLGYAPALSFAEGMARTGRWLHFVGVTRRS